MHGRRHCSKEQPRSWQGHARQDRDRLSRARSHQRLLTTTTAAISCVPRRARSCRPMPVRPARDHHDQRRPVPAARTQE